MNMKLSQISNNTFLKGKKEKIKDISPTKNNIDKNVINKSII